MKKIMTVVCILAIFGFANAQDFNFHMYEPECTDARSGALGMTSLFSSNKASFVFNNPAQLSMLENKSIVLSSRFRYGQDVIQSVENDQSDEQILDYPFHLKLNSISFTMPIKTKLENYNFGIGVGYRTYYDMGFHSEWNEYDEISDRYYKNEVTSKGGVNTLTLGVSASHQNRIAIGLSLNFPLMSNIEGEYIDERDNRSTEFTGTLEGKFIVFGAIYKHDYFSVGLRYRTGFELERDVTVTGSADDWWVEYYGSYFVDYLIPYELVLGLESQIINNLDIFTEFSTRNLSEYKSDTFPPQNIFYKNTDDGFSVRAGLEYDLNMLKYPLSIRCGSFFNSVPIYKREQEDGSNSMEYQKKPLTEIGFTAGAGVIVNENLSVDFFSSFSFISYEENQLIENPFPINDTRNEWDYYFYRLKIGISAGYKF